jgi:hypothetical protein
MCCVWLLLATLFTGDYRVDIANIAQSMCGVWLLLAALFAGDYRRGPGLFIASPTQPTRCSWLLLATLFAVYDFLVGHIKA